MSSNILKALSPLLDALEKLGVPYQVGGSLASSVHGVPRSSLDIDILRVQGDSLDRAYLSKWASELGVNDLLERAFIEAGLKAE